MADHRIPPPPPPPPKPSAPQAPDSEPTIRDEPTYEPPDVVNDFDVWAMVSARLLKRSAQEKQTILEQLLLDRAWDEANDHWLEVLAQDLVADRKDRIHRYHQLCSEELEKRPETLVSRTGDETQQDEDFRTELLHRIPQAVRDSEIRGGSENDPPPPTVPLPKAVSEKAQALLGPNKDFVARLAPADIQPKVPTSEQQITTNKGLGDATDAIRAAKSALQWPVEKYAKLCAELQLSPKRKTLIAATYGLRGQALIDYVHEGWHERLDKEEELRAEYKKLVTLFRYDIEKRRAGH